MNIISKDSNSVTSTHKFILNTLNIFIKNPKYSNTILDRLYQAAVGIMKGRSYNVKISSKVQDSFRVLHIYLLKAYSS